MKKKLVVLNTTFVLGLSSTFALPSVNAESISNLQKQKSSIQGQRAGLQANISAAEKKILDVQAELSDLNEQIARVEQAINDNQNQINQTEANIEKTNAEIAALENEIAIIKDRIEKRNEILKARALSFQESGGNVKYIDVLLGAESFSDFVDRVGAVTSIMEADKDILEKHEADKKEVEAKQAEVEKKLADLNGMKAELEGMQAQMVEQKNQNDQMKIELNQKQAANEALIADLKSQDSSLASQIASIQQNIATAQAQARAQALAQAQAQVSQASFKASSAPASSGNATQSNAPVASTPVKANGNIADVISAGYKYIGKSVYVFGGGRTAYDIANGRFDCSGFVHWAFSQAGISVGSSTDSLKFAGTQVPAGSMQPGDLVFFNTYKTDGHVGIYIGGGKFIGSQSSTGVAVANMSSGYWKDTFNGRVVRVK
ncbi:C40 family peptidase [Bacillus sp. 03113]|uniref:coiled-coil domain-containing protein n=1 Tax=Bacillus sp. 03113 TaxID=2578211 RepID=UPI0011433197|nr:C40 family peptidase [Bacillus sp. 03113]